MTDKEKLENVFDVKAATWDENPRRAKMAKVIAEAMRQAASLNDNMRAMELGCGTGLVSVLLSPSLKEVTAVDTSEQMLKVLDEKLRKNNISNIKTKLADLTKDEVFDERFDFIFSGMVFHHIEQYETVLKKFYELLNDGGYVCIADLEAEDGSFHQDMAVEHNGFSKDEFSSSLEEAGFTEIEHQTIFEIEKPDAEGKLRKYPIFLMSAVKK
jgi:ubiquinone/menaquinone biosynthesis C-methylase UbiE